MVDVNSPDHLRHWLHFTDGEVQLLAFGNTCVSVIEKARAQWALYHQQLARMDPANGEKTIPVPHGKPKRGRRRAA